MEKKSINLILLTSLLVCFIIIIVLLVKIYNRMEIGTFDNVLIQENSANNTNNEVQDDITTNDTTNTDDEKDVSSSAQVNNIDSTNTKIDYTSNDLIVIEELEEIEKNTESLLKEGTSESVGEKAKGIFISLVDFVFYDGEINGVTFDELSEAGKEKVLKIVSSIDTKIENKFPNYKDEISDKTFSAFNKASELIKNGANNIKEFSKEKLGEENYNAIIDAKDELVTYTKAAVSIIKEVGGNFWANAKEKIKTWYENFKSNN